MKRWLLSVSLLLVIISYFALSSQHIKIVKYVLSLQYTKLTQRNWWNKIEPYNIYLGAIPLDSVGHGDKIIDMGVHSILCLLEDFELDERILDVPVQHARWREAGLCVRHIKAVDFNPLKREEIKAGIAFLVQESEMGHTVYVHCKAGRGRSATIVVGFLMETENLTLEGAIDVVKYYRPEINLNTYQRQALIEYAASM